MSHDQTGLRRILVVEDEQTIRNSLVEILEAEGYSAVGAADGQKALEYLEQTSTLPCAILLDLMMPNLDGWGFRAEQKNDPRWTHIPIVVITADGNAKQKAQKMRAEGWVRKPIEIPLLMEAVQRLCF